MAPSPSFHARPARPVVHRTTPVDPGLLPVTRVCLPHLRISCLLVARADLAEWDPVERDFLPALDTRPCRAGANGVGTYRDGRLDVSAYQSQLEAMRWRVLVDGSATLDRVIENGSFLREYPCERGLVATVPYWETPRLVGRDRELKWATDHAARHDFTRRCVEAGLIDDITPEARTLVYERAKATLLNLEIEAENRARGGKPSRSLVDACRALEVRIAHMEARLNGDDPMQLEAEPTVDTRRGRARRIDDEVPMPPPPAPPPPMVTLADAQAMAAAAAAEAVAKALAGLQQPPRRQRKAEVASGQ